MNENTSAPTDASLPDEIGFPEGLIEADDLIEEVSIDGMCGVY
ncbi:mycofactocin precursor MftA [Streptomyces sp. NPDC059893]